MVLVRMTREDAQDALIALAAQWRKMGDSLPEHGSMVISAENLKKMARHMESIASNFAKLVFE